MDEQLPKITFSEFNKCRSSRGADAARFDVTDEDGDSYLLWMSIEDIRSNILKYPHCKEELQKGLRCYT